MTTNKFSFAVLSPHRASHEKLAEGLAATGAIRVVATAERPEELEALLSGSARVGLYVDVCGDPEKALGWIESLAEPRPPVLAGGPADPACILRAMRSGAIAYFPEHSFDDELTRIAGRLQAEAAAEAPAKSGHVVAVVGAKGGVGCTTVAVELAAQLARGETRVAVLDGNPYFGDVALHLDLVTPYTLADVAAREDDLDSAFLATVAHRHARSGIHVVAAPASPEDAEGVTAAHVERSAELLRAEFDFVVVDLPRLTDDVSLQVLDKADLVVLVTTRDVASLVRARQKLAVLDQLGHGAGKVRVAVNAASEGGLLRDEDPVAAVGLDASVRIPRADDAVQDAVAKGEPAALGHKGLARAFASLAADVAGTCEVALADEEGGEAADWKDRVKAIVEDVRCRLQRA